ncbi:MAG: hypothetical protein Tsb009_09290 [Planctomycetaceae bacterium]
MIANAKDDKIKELTSEKAENGVITFDDDGFSVERKSADSVRMKWDEVREIQAYKADLFSYDLICWVFLGKDDVWVEVNEEMVGFAKLEKHIEKRFEFEDRDWFHKVAFPAFETNLMTLWKNTKTI